MKILTIALSLLAAVGLRAAVPINVQKVDNIQNYLVGSLVVQNGQSISATGTGTIIATSAAPSGAAGGVLAGTYPNPTLAPSPAFTGTPTFANTGFTVGATTPGSVTGLAGALTLAAAGSNQNVSLIPSGSGLTSIKAGSGDIGLRIVRNNGTDKWDIGVDSNPSPFLQFLNNGGTTRLRVYDDGTLLVAGLTTKGTGVLQFPVATTAAGGITFGVDTALYRGAAGVLIATGTRIQFLSTGSDIGLGASDRLYFSTGQLQFVTAGATALTLDSSQNATFAGVIATGSTPATTGQIRLPSASVIRFRNTGNSGNLDAVSSDVNDNILIGNGTSTIIGSNLKIGNASTTAFFQNTLSATSGFTYRDSNNVIFLTLSNSAGAPTFTPGSNTDLTLQSGSQTNSVVVGGTFAQTSGSAVVAKITPTYNQASGTAANTDLLINRTQTAVGSGNQFLIDAQVGGVSKFSVNNAGSVGIVNGSSLYWDGNGVISAQSGGTVTIKTNNNTTALTLDTSQNATFAGNAIITNGKTLSWGTSTILNATADGRLLLTSSAANDFGRLQLGGTTSSYPAIKRSSTTLAVRLADDSADAPISSSDGTFSGVVSQTSGTTGTLATNATANIATLSTAGAYRLHAIGGNNSVSWYAACVVYSSGSTLSIQNLANANIDVTNSSGAVLTLTNLGSSNTLKWALVRLL